MKLFRKADTINFGTERCLNYSNDSSFIIEERQRQNKEAKESNIVIIQDNLKHFRRQKAIIEERLNNAKNQVEKMSCERTLKYNAQNLQFWEERLAKFNENNAQQQIIAKTLEGNQK